MFKRIIHYLDHKIKEYDRKSFEKNFKYAQDIVDVDRILRNLERSKPGGIL